MTRQLSKLPLGFASWMMGWTLKKKQSTKNWWCEIPVESQHHPDKPKRMKCYPKATVLCWQNDAWKTQPSTRFMAKPVGFITSSTTPTFWVVTGRLSVSFSGFNVDANELNVANPTRIGPKLWKIPLPSMEEAPDFHSPSWRSGLVEKMCILLGFNFAKSNKQMADMVSGQPVMFHETGWLRTLVANMFYSTHT